MWGFVAIYVINMARDQHAIAYLALVLGAIGFAIALLGKLNLIRKTLG